MSTTKRLVLYPHDLPPSDPLRVQGLTTPLGTSPHRHCPIIPHLRTPQQIPFPFPLLKIHLPITEDLSQCGVTREGETLLIHHRLGEFDFSASHLRVRFACAKLVSLKPFCRIVLVW